jgi:hypothetical protein
MNAVAGGIADESLAVSSSWHWLATRCRADDVGQHQHRAGAQPDPQRCEESADAGCDRPPTADPHAPRPEHQAERGE